MARLLLLWAVRGVSTGLIDKDQEAVCKAIDQRNADKMAVAQAAHTLKTRGLAWRFEGGYAVLVIPNETRTIRYAG